MVIAVTGATGFLGQALLDAALGEGVEVRALTRKPQPDRAGVTWLAGDLANRQALTLLCLGADALIHVAGLVNTPDPAQFAVVNAAGTLNVIRAARVAGLSRVIVVSSLTAREPGLSAYGASKAEAEQLVIASGLDWTIVRPPAIYGPRDTELFELFRAARWGVVPVPARGRASLIHAQDLAALLLALVPGGEAVSCRSFEPDDGQPGGWRHGDLARAIGDAVFGEAGLGRTGRKPFVLCLPAWAIHAAAWADRQLRGDKAKLTPDRAGYMTHDWVVSPAAAVPPKLWRSRIPTRAGLAATAQWYREQGWL